MKKNDLKAGMLLLCEEGGCRELCLVSYNDDGHLNWSGEHIWADEEVLNDDLTYGVFDECKILKVYDRIHGNCGAHELKTDRRELLWERKHTPKVGDVYEGLCGDEFVITRVTGDSYNRLFNDGSGGLKPIEQLDDLKFTGRNIKEELQDLFDEIEV